jgi:hypothetical protein
VTDVANLLLLKVVSVNVPLFRNQNVKFVENITAVIVES